MKSRREELWKEMNKKVEEIIEKMFQRFNLAMTLKHIPTTKYLKYEQEIIDILLKEAKKERIRTSEKSKILRSQYIAMRIRQYHPFLIHYNKILRIQTIKRAAGFYHVDCAFGHVRSRFISKYMKIIDSVGEPFNLGPKEVCYPDFYAAGVDPLSWANKYLYRWYHQNRDFAPVLPRKKQIKHFKPRNFHLMAQKLSRNLNLRIPSPNDIKFRKLILFQRSWAYPKMQDGVWKTELKVERIIGIYLLMNGLHELGHAIHNLNQPENFSIMDGFFNSLIVKETIPELFQNLLLSEDFLKEMCGLNPEEAEGVRVSYEKYQNLIAGMSAVKMKFHLEFQNHKWNIKQAKSRYIYYFHRFMNYSLKQKPKTLFDIFYPVLYDGNYVVSHELAKYLRRDLEQNFGKKWWKNQAAGKWLKENWMRIKPGDKIPHLDEALAMKLL